MWDLSTLKKLNDDRAEYLKNQRETWHKNSAEDLSSRAELRSDRSEMVSALRKDRKQ